MKRATQPLQHVTIWRKSGLTQADYCRQEGLNPKTFSAWIRNNPNSDMDAPLKVIPVEVIPSEPIIDKPEPMTLRFKQGIQLELSTAVSPRWLAELLRCLA